MRVLKLLLTVALIGGLFVVWRQREPVVAAYTEDSPPLELHFDGLELAGEREDLGPSPFVVSVAAPDLRANELGPEIAGQPGDPAPRLGGGSAVVQGRVFGPAGPLPGATVIVERHVLGGADQAVLPTGEDGSFSVSGVLGGRFRVRAHVPGSLGMDTTSVFFLPAGDSVDLELVLRSPSPDLVIDLVAGGETPVGSVSTVAVSLGRESVDELGHFIVGPVAGRQVDVGVSGVANLISADLVTTDSRGIALYSFECPAPGASSLVAKVAAGGDEPAPPSVGRFALPNCVAPPPPEDEPEGASAADSDLTGDESGE